MCRQTHCQKQLWIKRTGKMCKLLWLTRNSVLRPSRINSVIKANKQKQETKYSSAISGKDTETTQSLTTTKITLLFAEVLSKIKNSFNKMSYSNIISVVSNSASRCNCLSIKKIMNCFGFWWKNNYDNVCLNEVKKWQKRIIQEKYSIVTEAKASSFHGPVINAKRA